MRPTAEAVVKALLVIDREAGRFLVMERAAGLILAARFLDFDSFADERRQRCPCSQLIKKLRR